MEVLFPDLFCHMLVFCLLFEDYFIFYFLAILCKTITHGAENSVDQFMPVKPNTFFFVCLLFFSGKLQQRHFSVFGAHLHKLAAPS